MPQLPMRRPSSFSVTSQLIARAQPLLLLLDGTCDEIAHVGLAALRPFVEAEVTWIALVASCRANRRR